MTRNSDGLRVLVTAGCSGIGLAIARAFAKDGAILHVCDISREAIERCRQENPDFGVTLADVSNEENVQTLFREAVQNMGGLDVLVNNAGIAGPTGPIESLDYQDWRRTMEVDLDSLFLCTKEAVPYLKASKRGSIVNISSTAGIFGYPLRSPYAAAKWAVVGLTKTLAMELGTSGVRVNAICPGAVSGARMDRVIAADALARDVGEDVVRREIENQVSLRTFVDPEDIANMALFLCSPGGARISGQILAVDGHTESLSKTQDRTER
ncbi:MAG: SDR family oxidoreductase [Kiloniellales bacterium]|nr:SDR family oxidoreductase [Kiloniellales bacterium]